MHWLNTEIMEIIVKIMQNVYSGLKTLSEKHKLENISAKVFFYSYLKILF